MTEPAVLGRRRAATGAALLLPLTLLVPTSPAPAAAEPQAAARYAYYGAISLNPTDAAGGWATDYTRKKGAIRAAQRACKRRSDVPWDCRKIVWVSNGCAAVVVRYRDNGSISRYAWAIGGRKRTAIKRAKAELNWHGRTHTWVCTTR